MNSDIKSICSYIELLIKPSCHGNYRNVFTNLELELKARIQDVFQKLQLDKDLCQQVENLSPMLLRPLASNTQFEIRWTFIEWCLVFLTLLRNNLNYTLSDQRSSDHSGIVKNQHIPQSNMLSISQEKTVLAAVQFIVALGITPSLLQGVGIPLHKRSHQGTVFQESQDDISPQQKHRRLVASTVIILNCINHSSLGSIILTSHFIDVLSALCQLCYAPIKKSLSSLKDNQIIYKESSANEIKFTENVENCGNSPSVATLLKRLRDIVKLSEEQLIKEMWEDRNYLIFELEKLIRRSYKPLLVSTLLQLQGNGILHQQKGKTGMLPSPKWMRQACGSLLTKELIQPRGVFYIIEGMLIIDPEDQREDIEKWRKYEALGKIIAHVPNCSSSADIYYKTISPQILSLLQMKGMEANRIVHWITVCIISSMLEHKPTLTEKYIFKPLLKPLRCCLMSDHYPYIENDGTVCASEKELTLCIENLHKIALYGSNLSLQVHNKLVSVFIPLFHLLCFTLEGVFHLRQKIEDIVIVLLKSSDNPVQLLVSALFDTYSPEQLQAMRTDIKFEYGEEACIKIIKKDFLRFSGEDFISENIKKCSCGVYILQNLNDKKLIGNIFFYLLQELQEALKDLEIEDKDGTKSQSSKLKVNNESDLPNKLHKNLLLIQLIQEISDQFGEVIVEDNDQALQFIQTTLDRCIYLNKAEDSLLGIETVSLVLGALTMLVTQKDKLKSEDWTRMKNCIPNLRKIMLNFQDDIKTTAQELITIISTHGAAGWNRLGQKNDKDKWGNASRKKLEKKVTILTESNISTTGENIKGSIKSDIDGMNSICINADQNIQDHQNLIQENPNAIKTSTYQVALEELNDILLPVRGHALIELKKLILSRDPETLQNSDRLLKIFTEFLSDMDSYIYLPAIQCLSALGTIYAEKVIPVLSIQFSQVDKPNELKIKIAEALMHIVRALGEISPKYRDILLPLFLCGTKNVDSEIRASSLSNLGETCQRLKYALGPYLQEILMCIQSYLKTDSSVKVRRAAVLTLSLLLRGLGSDSLIVLEKEMRDLYHLLKLCYVSESDDIVKLHVQIALEEIDIIVKENFCSQRPLIKEIKVLHP